MIYYLINSCTNTRAIIVDSLMGQERARTRTRTGEVWVQRAYVSIHARHILDSNTDRMVIGSQIAIISVQLVLKHVDLQN